MKRFPAAFIGLACFSALSLRAPALFAEDRDNPAGSRPPNIVLILADDLGFSDLGAYGGEIRTPNLDRLARQGIRFTQFYNCAKCTTTRAALLTGLYPRPRGGLLKRNMVTLGEVLKSAGYRTSLSGKWHLGRSPDTHPYHRGFDEYYGLLDGCSNHFDPSRRDPPFKGGRVRVFGHNDRRIEKFPPGFYSTDAFTDHAIECLRRFAAEGRPFFIHIAYTAPHYPLHAPPEDIERYRGKYAAGWHELRKRRFERQKKLGLATEAWKLSGPDPRAYDWETSPQAWEDLRMAVYAAMVDRIDRNVGRFLDELRRLGLEKTTAVFFLSDNGGCAEEPGGRRPQETPGGVESYVAVGPAWGWAQNAPFRRYKSWVHEGGIATPFIARWPGVTPEGAIVRDPAHVIDILPTFAEMAGAAYPREYGGREILPVEGRSFLPLLRGGARTPHPYLFWEWAGNRAVRRGDWKLVWDRDVKRWELYNLARDRSETEDLALEKPALVRELGEAWRDWAIRTGVLRPGRAGRAAGGR